MIYSGLMNQTHAIPFLYSTGGLDKSSPYNIAFLLFSSNSVCLVQSIQYGFDKLNPCKKVQA